MKRVESFLRKKVEEVKVSMKIKKIETALEAALNNAEEDKIDAELALQSLMENMAETSDLSNCITRISDAFDKLETADLTIERLEKIRKFLNEDVKVTEEKK